MRILYVSQYFPPEMGAPAARVHELSREWVNLGCEVTVLTGFAHHPVGIKAPRDRYKITRRESQDGIDVVRSYVYATPNKAIVKRMISYASFMCSAILVGMARVEKPDVVIATSPQLLCACAGYALARWFRVPFIFEVRDLWPESIIAVEAMRKNIVVRGLKKVAAFLYKKADRIVTVGPGYSRKMIELYGVPPQKIDIVTNGIDTGIFIPGPRDNEVRREYGWDDRFVIMYVGTHGMAHALDKVLEAARELCADPAKLFVFVGEGAEKQALKKKAQEWKLANVAFIDQQPKDRVTLYYAACDLGLVTLRNTPLFQEVLPSKLFEYLGMERPVIVTVDGEPRNIVETSASGEFVPPEDVPAMVEAIQRLSSGRARLEEMGRSGREYVVANYDRKALAKRYLEILERLRA
ncbi:MAG TPA: glycosyltransferase family 4 protein [bacterium]|nr:glycosyltransferase family 4 protein [bacterium]